MSCTVAVKNAIAELDTLRAKISQIIDEVK